MSYGINKVMIAGNVGQDATFHTTDSGMNIANFSIATTESWKDKSGEKQEKTEWHRVVLFGRLAETANNYAKKGAKIFVEGKLQTRKYDDKEGVTRYTTEVLATNFQVLVFADSKGKQDSQSSNTDNYEDVPF